MKAWILNVGDEVLSGKVVNTNFSTISIYFSQIGVDVTNGIIIGDNRNDIKVAVNDFMNSDVDILITTGGLGPTHDDFTKEVISETLDLKLLYSEKASNDMFNYFLEKKNDCNIKQVYYPEGSIVITNRLGSADGFIIEKNNKMIISLVGVPFEMEGMLKDEVLPYLQAKGNVKLCKEYLVMGDSESGIENRLIPFIDSHPYVSICPYCAPGKLRYQLTADKYYEDAFNKTVEDFEEFMGDLIVCDKYIEIEEIVVKELLDKDYHISFAESCTGGMIASTLINVSGASNVINESYITYSNKSKIDLLNVKESTINNHSVVSAEVVKEMVLGLYDRTKSEVCISVSGYADGDNAGKMFFAIKVGDVLKIYDYQFRGKRNYVRLRAVRTILYELHILLKNK